ncbi:hypothetical protein ACU4GD_10255 [Cupriavidus basilensis]
MSRAHRRRPVAHQQFRLSACCLAAPDNARRAPCIAAVAIWKDTTSFAASPGPARLGRSGADAARADRAGVAFPLLLRWNLSEIPKPATTPAQPRAGRLWRAAGSAGLGRRFAAGCGFPLAELACACRYAHARCAQPPGIALDNPRASIRPEPLKADYPEKNGRAPGRSRDGTRYRRTHRSAVARLRRPGQRACTQHEACTGEQPTARWSAAADLVQAWRGQPGGL